ncbi:MAG: hypothetical protein AABX55_01760 [Nanoarchaeota archaeon]
MSFFTWLKSLFFENEAEIEQIEAEMQNVQPVTQADYSFKIFDLKSKDELNNITSFIVQDRSLALVKMNKFTGDSEEFKHVLNELKNTCDNCNSKVIGINNNTFLVAKNSIEILK